MSVQPHPYRCRVRPASLADVPAVVRMARQFYEQTEYTKVPFCEEGAASFWCDLMLSQGLLFIAEDDDGKPVGMIGGAMSPFLMNPAYSAGAELFMWVEPEARGNGTAGRLMDAIEAAARDAGCTYWTMIALKNLHPEMVCEIYRRRGYREMEIPMVLEL